MGLVPYGNEQAPKCARLLFNFSIWGNGAVVPAERRIAKMTYTLCVTYINASCGV
jgi:hypothetical protein